LLFTFYEPLGFEAPWLRFWSLSLFISLCICCCCVHIMHAPS
jgi:hypothetical protein